MRYSAILAGLLLIGCSDDAGPGAGGTGATGGSGGAPECQVDAECAPSADVCYDAKCNANHACELVPAANRPCDDGDGCTLDDTCQNGTCTGTPLECVPTNECWVASCDPVTQGCIQEPAPAGTACEDDDPCTATGTCDAAQCMPGPSCEAQSTFCLESVCTPTGCETIPVNVGAACDDGLYCTSNETCDNSGVCGNGSATCTGTDCTIASCDEVNDSCMSVPGNDGAACDDGIACSANSTCLNGVCGGGAIIGSCINGDGCCPAGCTNAQDDDCIYWATGVQTNVPETALAHWQQCYSDNYAQTAPLSTILAACNKASLLMACRPVGQPTFNLVAMAARADVLFDCDQSNNCVHQANGVGWYFDEDYSWGFAPGGEPVNRLSCDFNAGNQTQANLRLCWHTGGNEIQGGYRCGNNDLNGNSAWERVIYQAD